MPNPAAGAQIQLADPDARRRALLWLAAMVATGAGALLGLQRWLARLGSAGDVAQAADSLASALWLTSSIAAMGLVALGAYVWRQAERVHLNQRFPPPGQPVIRDTVVLEGRAALNRAKALRVVSVLLVVAGVCLVVVVRLVEPSLRAESVAPAARNAASSEKSLEAAPSDFACDGRTRCRASHSGEIDSTAADRTLEDLRVLA